MTAASLRARYLGDSIATASPPQLLVMLYDRLALDLERGHAAMAAGDRETASQQLQHAQEIILELQASLKVEIWDGGRDQELDDQEGSELSCELNQEAWFCRAPRADSIALNCLVRLV